MADDGVAEHGGRRLDGPIAALAGRQHGVVARRQLRDLGFADSAVESRLRRGALLAVHRGVYAVGHRELTQEGRWMAAVLACGEGAVLSHRSAGQLWGLVPRSASVPEVMRVASFRKRPGILVHRTTLRADEFEIVDGIPVTSATRTLLDLAAILDERRLERAMNEAEVGKLTSRLSLPELLRRHRGRQGTAAIRRILDAHGASLGITRNELEERFLALVDRHGLPRPRLNADLVLRGRFYEVDCLWQSQQVMVELDGRAVHGTRRAFEADRERDRILLAEGWLPMRVTWRQLQDEPETIVGDLRRLLRSRAAD